MVAALGIAALAACTDDAAGPEAATYAIAVESGDDQLGATGAELGEPLAVRVVEAGTDDGVEGVPVTWRVLEGAGAEILTPTTLTDTGGVARARVRLGPDTGAYRIAAVTNRLFGKSAAFGARAVLPPRIQAIEPRRAAVGDTVVVTGENFGGGATGVRVLFGGFPGTVVGATETELRVRVPRCVPSRTVPVTVLLGPVRSAADTMDVTGVDEGSLALEPGGVARLDGTDLDCVRLPGGTAGAAYMLVLQNAIATPDRSMPFQLVGLSDTAASPPTLLADRGVIDRGPGPSDPALAWEVRLRARERRIAADEIIRPADRALRPQATPTVPRVGDRRTFEVINKDDEFESVTAEVVHVSDHAILYQDVNAPEGGFTSEDFRAFGELFDDPIYDTDVAAFGEPSDIDENGRIIILFTPVVNAMTERDRPDNGFIAGFFYGLDLTDREHSNRAEIFYSIVPDPEGEFSDERSKDKILRTVPPVLAHELQHMIHFNQRRIVRSGTSGEVLWLSEALAHMAEDLVGDVLLARGAGTTASDFKRANYIRGYLYLEDPGAVSLVSEEGPGGLKLRGAAWLFLKYLMGHHGGEDLLRRLTQTTRTGVANVAGETGVEWGELFHRWAVALWADGAAQDGTPVDSIYTFTNVALPSEMEYWLHREFPLSPTQQSFDDFVLEGELESSSPGYVVLHSGASIPNPLRLRFSAPYGADFPTSVLPRIGLVRVR